MKKHQLIVSFLILILLASITVGCGGKKKTKTQKTSQRFELVE